MNCILRLACLALLSLVASGLPVNERDIVTLDGVDYRLPTTISPSNYNITLKTYLLETDGAKQFTFEGETFVTFIPKVANLSSIIMHSRNLSYSIRELYQTATPNTKLTISAFSVDVVTDKYTLNVTQALTANVSYTLHFVYTGPMQNDMNGYYKTSYPDARNNTKWLGATQVHLNYGRAIFPCFDEPNFKATYDLNLIHHKSFKTFGNTRIVRMEKIDDDYWRDVYSTTPTMSSYLLAFIVSDFIERTDGEFSVIARPEYYSQTEYALDVGRLLMRKFDNYTALPYYTLGIDKLHLAGIPDFSAGAMENWGLITYREYYVLYDERSTSLYSKQRIASIISHELAHMWFGDLVTCDWWGYTWLNEGFGRYFEYFMTDVVYPEWELDQQFVLEQLQNVFTLDSTKSTSPMSDVSSLTPGQQLGMFNSISYNKGASIIRMIKHAIGKDAFEKSLQTYLKQYQYQNTVPQNLFDHWSTNWPAASKVYADGVMKSFTEQVGYPLIHFEVSSDNKSMTIQQKRFLLKSDDGSNSSLLYTVPITYTTNVENNFNQTTPKMYLEAKTDKVTVNFGTVVNWVIGNIQETGYYRTNYSEVGWHRIHTALKLGNWSSIHELNRAQYVDDLLALARAGELTYIHSLNCLDYLATETKYAPWTAAFNGYNYLAIRLGLDKQQFGSYIIELTKKAYSTLGFEETKNDTTLDIYTRNKVISWACKYGHQDCISKSLKLFRNMTMSPVPVNIREAVYCTAMRNGTENDFNMLYNKFKLETVPTEMTLIINNLGCVREQKLIERYFHIIVSNEIRPQDKSSALSGLYSNNAENVSPVFELVTKNVDALATSMGSYSAVASVISNIASRFTTDAQLKSLETFISTSSSKFETSVSTLHSAVTAVKENLAWDNQKLGGINTYIKGYLNGGAGITRLSLSVLTVVIIAFVSSFFN